MRAKTAASNERTQQADALIARMKKARGYIYPEWEFAACSRPAWCRAARRRSIAV